MQSILQAGRTRAFVRSAGRGAAVVVIAALSSSVASPADAQVCAADAPLALYSPETLNVEFEQAGVLGNRLTWPGVAPELGSCTTLLVSPDLQTRTGVRLEGNFLDVYDRRVGVQFTETGLIGSTTQSNVRVTVENSHPNPAAANVVVTLNLSGRGGIFRWNPDNGRAVQSNVGVPPHLSSTNVRSLAASADGSRVYAGVTQVPILRSDNGGPWIETTVGTPPFTVEPEAIVVSRVNPDRLWVRSNREGIWRSEDAGATWQLETGISRDANVDYRYFDQIDVIPPGGTTPQPVIFVYAAGLGLYYSADDGMTWTIAEGLEVPRTSFQGSFELIEKDVLVPATDVEVFDIEASRVNPGRVYMALQDWGVYEVDVQGGFDEWIPRYDGLVLGRGEDQLLAPLGRKRSVTDVVVLEPLEVTPDGGGAPVQRDQIVALSDLPPIVTEQNPDDPVRPVTIAFTSNDGGVSWDERASNYPATSPDLPIRSNLAFRHPDTVGEPRTIVAGIRGEGLWQLRVPEDDTIAAWAPVDFADDAELLNPSVRTALTLDSGEVIIGTINAGAYSVGQDIDLDRAIALGTEAGVAPVVTGITLAFDNAGQVNNGDRLEVIAQSFQGYAVWRSGSLDPETNEPQWELIGLLDLSNPETCSIDPCDAVAIETVPGCFAEKRANCFSVNPSLGLWGFFDRDVGAGFTYDYAVSTFDYGFTGDENPEGSLRDFVFSPRSALESSDQSPQEFRDLQGGENFNRVFFQVNTEPAGNLDEVWAVPNPFVRSAGWDDLNDNFIRFFNVTETAQVEIFTIAGDFVRRLENVVFNDRQTGLIEWDTRNAEGEQVASGVYIFRVTDDDGGEEMGRLTLIR